MFIFEAPNRDDTFDKDKGYLTYDRETDPTGRFTRCLMVDELGLDPGFFQVTNSVLCLPAEIDGKFPISSGQRERCALRIGEQIQVLDPAVVVPVGGKALKAASLLECHPYREILKVVARPRRWLGRWLFPLCHTSRLGRGNRPEQKQREDWRRLRHFLEEQGVFIPARGAGSEA